MKRLEYLASRGDLDALDALGWRRHAWTSMGGSAKTAGEVVRFSPHCLGAQLDLFEGVAP